MSIKNEQSSFTPMDYPKWISRDVFQVENGFSHSSPPYRRATRSPELDCDGEPFEADLKGDAPNSQVAPEGQSRAIQVLVEDREVPRAQVANTQCLALSRAIVSQGTQSDPRRVNPIFLTGPQVVGTQWLAPSGANDLQSRNAKVEGTSRNFPLENPHPQGTPKVLPESSQFTTKDVCLESPKVIPGNSSVVPKLRPEMFS
jgi:hypothetical protein